MKPLICAMLAIGLLGGATAGVDVAEAHGRKHWKHRHHDDRSYRDHGYRGRHVRYVSEREVYVVREYYRPRYRHEPRPPYRYYRSGYLPHGWHRRIRPYPVYLERDLVVLPHGYRRGVIDGHAVVYNGRGMIIDVAVLF
jgi:hypothetical protein